MTEWMLDSEKGIVFTMLPVSDLIPNDWNPNEMPARLLDALAKDVGEVGFLQPVLVSRQEDGTYRIVDGEHRVEVARICDMESVPAVILPSQYDEDFQKFQTVRMNKLRGRLSKVKLKALVSDLVERHPITEVAERLLFDGQEELEELFRDAREALPTEELKREFDKKVSDVRSFDDLQTLLHSLYLRYGDQLDYGFMVFDFGGKKHVWIRVEDEEAFEFIRRKVELVRSFGIELSSVLRVLFRELTEEFLREHSSEFRLAKGGDGDEF